MFSDLCMIFAYLNSQFFFSFILFDSFLIYDHSTWLLLVCFFLRSDSTMEWGMPPPPPRGPIAGVDRIQLQRHRKGSYVPRNQRRRSSRLYRGFFLFLLEFGWTGFFFLVTTRNRKRHTWLDLVPPERVYDRWRIYTPTTPPAHIFLGPLVVASLPTTTVNDRPINLSSGNIGCKDIPWLVITISVTAYCSLEHSTVGGAELMFDDGIALAWLANFG